MSEYPCGRCNQPFHCSELTNVRVGTARETILCPNCLEEFVKEDREII